MKGMAAVLCVAVCGIIILPLIIAGAYYGGETAPVDATEANTEETTPETADEPLQDEETYDTNPKTEETAPTEETTAPKTTMPPVTEAPPETDNGNEGVRRFNDSDMMKLYNTSTGECESIRVADYLYGVVMAEMPSYFDTEALKAQAVACRSYLYFKILNTKTTSSYHGGTDADICTNHAHCAAYISYDAACLKYGDGWANKIFPKIKEAVDATDGQFVLYEGEIANTFFHSSSYLATEDVKNVWGSTKYPYLVSVSSPEDESFEKAVTTVTITADALKKIIEKESADAVFSDEKAQWIGKKTLNENGRVAEITVCGAIYTGREMRSLFGLRSTDFDAEYKKDSDSFIFTVRGNGHGVGMSQHGANLLAEQGMKYHEILTHYFKGTTVGAYQSKA